MNEKRRKMCEKSNYVFGFFFSGLLSTYSVCLLSDVVRFLVIYIAGAF